MKANTIAYNTITGLAYDGEAFNASETGSALVLTATQAAYLRHAWENVATEPLEEFLSYHSKSAAIRRS